MLNVFITVDTEIWCNGWENIDEKFPQAFSQYVYGPTAKGNYGLPIQFEILNDNGLTGIFFIEPLFATRFGLPPLQELVGLTQDAGQEIQLHLHTEWVDEARTPLLPNVTKKQRWIKKFSREDQTLLLSKGLQLMQSAGAKGLNAFRAGSFALNYDTLLALADNGIEFDTSYNPASVAGIAEVSPGQCYTQPLSLGGIKEYPVTVFRDRGGESLRHLQLTACSFAEMQFLLNTAHDRGLDSVVIVSHNFELLSPSKRRSDPIVVRRFEKLCRFLSNNSDRFSVKGFQGLQASTNNPQDDPIQSRADLTARRMAEQAMRRCFA